MKNRKLAKCQEGAEFRGSISSVKRNERKRERGGGKIRSRGSKGEGRIQDGVGEVKGRAPGISTH